MPQQAYCPEAVVDDVHPMSGPLEEADRDLLVYRVVFGEKNP